MKFDKTRETLHEEIKNVAIAAGQLVAGLVITYGHMYADKLIDWAEAKFSN